VAAATGWQPKFATNTPQLFCSAVCERRGSFVLLYGCDDRLTDVVDASAIRCEPERLQ
jgi:hypothetical protein